MIKKVCVIDSGIGGLSILSNVYKNFKDLNYVYICDEKNLPYGNKDKKTLNRLCLNLLNRSKKYNPCFYIIACNTLSTNCKKLILNYTFGNVVFVSPNYDKITNYDSKEVCVLCTNNTANYIKKERNDIYKCVLPLNDFATLIENSFFNRNKIEVYVKKLNCNKKYIFLNCTHYILVKQIFKKYYPESIIFDGVEQVISDVYFFIDKFNLIKKNSLSKKGTVTFDCQNAIKNQAIFNMLISKNGN